MISGVAGIIIWTENIERLAGFYRDVLRLPVHSTQPDFVAFAFGDFRLSIGRHDKVKAEARDPYRVMINLSVEDIQATYKALSEHGIRFLRPPEREHWGGWMASFLDPDGNILQLLQQPEVSK